jgi:hypothetical protein
VPSQRLVIAISHMKTTVLAAMAIGAMAIGIGIASPAAADPNNCQTVGGATVCSQGGDVRGGDQSAAPYGPGTWPPRTSGCLTPYGTPQKCERGGGGGG